MTLKLTPNGKELLLRAYNGDCLNFTKIQIGNGVAPSEETDSLINPLYTEEISSIQTDSNYATLGFAFNNGNVDSGFHVTELGVFASDPENFEQDILYAYGVEDESKADYIPGMSDRVIDITYDIIVFVGNAENITAQINGSRVYVTAEAFQAHEQSANPHHTTKSDVGLGDVPNVSTNDQTPTWDGEASTLVNIQSGDTLRVICSKIMKLITDFIMHRNDKNNPHAVTTQQIGAASSSHTHSATDINAGILSVARGGTGANTEADARESIGAAPAYSYGTEDLIAGSSELPTGILYFVYE